MRANRRQMVRTVSKLMNDEPLSLADKVHLWDWRRKSRAWHEERTRVGGAWAWALRGIVAFGIGGLWVAFLRTATNISLGYALLSAVPLYLAVIARWLR